MDHFTGLILLGHFEGFKGTVLSAKN